MVQKLIFFNLCFLLCYPLQTALLRVQTVQGSSHRHHHHHPQYRPPKLFVFGDSYADTGNSQKAISESWKVPYGITFPGKPTGRFSDGRVFTDYLASFLGIKSPIPYRWRKFAPKSLHYGMNFAYGGTGVFDTLAPYPNMTTQMDFFQQLINEGVYTKGDLNYSVAHVSVVGNDYSTYVRRNGTVQDLPAFVISVVKQIFVNLKRIHGLGVPKVVITGLQPLGCLPLKTVLASYQECDKEDNSAVRFHNSLLRGAVQQLNNEMKNSPFGILNLYDGFMKGLNNSGSAHFKNPLKPCCMGINSKDSCGTVDKNGEKKYTVCDNPKSTFFWDAVHLTQEGWIALYSILQPSLHQLY